ncbi:MAG: NUDIX domain-containing protein, partial [Bacteroidota bacterium]
GGGPLGTDLLESAKRELREETGLHATDWTMIQHSYLSNSVSDEEAFVFLATGITQSVAEREETEADMKVKKVPFREAYQLVLDGTITDSLSVMGILKVALLRPEWIA